MWRRSLGVLNCRLDVNKWKCWSSFTSSCHISVNVRRWKAHNSARQRAIKNSCESCGVIWKEQCKVWPTGWSNLAERAEKLFHTRAKKSSQNFSHIFRNMNFICNISYGPENYICMQTNANKFIFQPGRGEEASLTSCPEWYRTETKYTAKVLFKYDRRK